MGVGEIMATWYVNFNNQYYLDDTVGAGNVGTLANPFNYNQLRTLVRGNPVNTISISNNDTIRITGTLTSDAAGLGNSWEVFDNMAISGLLVTSYESGAPWYYLDTVAATVEIHIPDGGSITVENCVVESNNFNIEDGAASGAYNFKNCLFYGNVNCCDGGLTPTLSFYGCSFSNATITCPGVPVASNNRSVLYEYCYFEGCVPVAGVNFGINNLPLTIQNCLFTLSRSQLNAQIASGTNLTVTSCTFDYPNADTLPAALSLTQTNLEYLIYGLPLVASSSLWGINDYTQGFYGESRNGYGAFKFDLTAAISASPDNGKGPLEVDFTNNVNNSDVDFLWDFGDSNTSTERSPTHTYSIPGTYTVYLSITDRLGNTYTASTTIYVYDFDYSAGGLHVPYTDRCLKYAIKPSHGLGWSYYGGADWLWPSAYNDSLNIFNDRDELITIVWDARDGLGYRVGELDVWTDKTSDYAGTEIAGDILFKEDIGETENYMIPPLEEHVFLRPEDEESRNTSGHDDAGYRDNFSVSLHRYEDGNLSQETTSARYIPLEGDITYDKDNESHRKQLRFTTTASEWKLVGKRSYYVAKDKRQLPSRTLLSEQSWQEHMAEPALWLSRGSNLVLNRAVGEDVSGSYFGTATGPDGISGSAMDFTGSQGLTYALPSDLTGDFTLMMWFTGGVSATLMSLSTGSGSMVISGGNLSFGGNGGAITWDGTAWGLFVVVREGYYMYLYQNDELLNTFLLGSIINYGGTVSIMSSQTGQIEDVRIYERSLGARMLDYYYRDVINNSGNSFLPMEE